MRCSLTASMCSSLDSSDIYDLPGWVIELAMASRRQQVVLDEQLAIRFFKDIKTCTMDSLAANRDQLAVPYTKAELVAAVVELMEEQLLESTPSDLLPWAMVALYQLSKMQPRTPKDLEARFLRLALCALVILEEPSQDPEGEEAFRNTIKMGEQLLRGLIEEDPSRDHLLSIVEVFGEVFPEERSSFLETARQGLPLPAPPTSNPGLLLFHSLIGMANDLLGAEVWMSEAEPGSAKQPAALQGLQASPDDLLIEDLEDEEASW
uniref:MROH2B-like HEAT-repeats domain-containing protein n=1 Tax=Pogona vitticeps TaxID=103695 RepID=A0ABM5ERW1_9SAUR